MQWNNINQIIIVNPNKQASYIDSERKKLELIEAKFDALLNVLTNKRMGSILHESKSLSYKFNLSRYKSDDLTTNVIGH
jgi:hypothetical protein